MRKIYILIILSLFIVSAKEILAQSPSTSAGIREKVQAKVEEALKNPKAFMGTVTDVSDGTIQIKNDKADIKQISVDEELTAVIDSTGKTNKEVKVKDIAIGDFIVAMGFKNTNEVLDSKRILIMAPLSVPIRKSYIGTVDSFAKSKGVLTILKDGKQISFITNTKTKFSIVEDSQIQDGVAADVEEGSKIVISGVEESTGLTARRILVIQPVKPL